MKYFEDLCTSYFVTDLQHHYIRTCQLIVALSMTIWATMFNTKNFLFYFTNWSWIGLSLYYIWTFMISRAYIKEQKVRFSTPAVAQRTAFLHHTLFAITETVTWMVAIIYWALLCGNLKEQRTPEAKALLVLEHSIDLVMMIVEMFFCKVSLSWYHVIFPVVIAYLFVFYTWVLVYSGVSFWPYPFMKEFINPNEKPAWIVILGLLIGTLTVCIIYAIVYTTYCIREYIAELALSKKLDNQKQDKYLLKDIEKDIDNLMLTQNTHTIDFIQ